MGGKFAALVVAPALAAVVLAAYLIAAQSDSSEDAARGVAKPTPTALPIQVAPNGGNVKETIAPGTPAATVKVRVSKPARLDNGVEIKVLSTETKKVKAGGPGEVGGPAVVGRVEIENKSGGPINVDGVIVTLVYGDNQVAQPSTSAPSSPFRGTLRRGEAGQGIYVFRVPGDSKSSLSIVVQYGAGSAVARFVQ